MEFRPPTPPPRWGTGPLVVGIALATIVVAVTLLVSPNLRWSSDRERNPFAGDFLHEWTGAYIVQFGEPSRMYDFGYVDRLQHDASLVGFRLRPDGFLPLVYPPVYYLAVSPLAALPYRTAAWTWVTLILMAFAAFVLLLGVAVTSGGSLDRVLPHPDERLRGVRRIGTLIALPAAVAFVPFGENLVAGQKATFILLVLTIAWLALQQGRQLAAGLVFGLMAMKPQLGFVIPLALLAKGCWRFALGVAITTTVLVAGSLAMGLDVAQAYVALVQTLPEQVRLGPHQLHRVHGAYGFFTILGGGTTWWVRAVTVATMAGMVWLLTRLLRGPTNLQSSRFIVQYAGLVVASVLLAPNVVTYDLTILVLPLSLLGTLLLRGGVRPAHERGVLWCITTTYLVCGLSPSVAARTSIQLTLPVLGVVLAFLSVRDDLLGEPGRLEAMHPEAVPHGVRRTDTLEPHVLQ